MKSCRRALVKRASSGLGNTDFISLSLWDSLQAARDLRAQNRRGARRNEDLVLPTLVCLRSRTTDDRLFVVCWDGPVGP